MDGFIARSSYSLDIADIRCWGAILNLKHEISH